jgi:D-arabinose 1-dehydrogenase-like Zn-dependent alcohol dehydrogenase
MVLRAREGPLILEEQPDPVPGVGEIRIRVEACAVCRTDLHVIDGVCGGIYMSDIPSFPYSILWEERRLVSVANLTRHDAATFLPLARQAQIRTSTTQYPLHAANEAVGDLRTGRIQGADVLVI